MGNIEEKVYGGVGDTGSKEIEIKIHLELSKPDREKYALSYLYLPVDFSNANQCLLRTVELVFSISVRGKSTQTENYHNRLVLSKIQMSNTSGGLTTILREDINPAMLILSGFITKSERKPVIAEDQIDAYLFNAISDPSHLTVNKLQFLEQGQSLQHALVTDFQKCLTFIGPKREFYKKVTDLYATPSSVDSIGRTLVNLISTTYYNDLDKFNDITTICKRIFPDVDRIHPKKHEDNNVSILVKKKRIPYEIDLANEASGLDQLFVIIWKVATSEHNAIWLLDEPELHIHPGAQKVLHEFLKEQTRSQVQILVATQSMVFIHKSELNEISLIIDRDDIFIILLEDLVKAEKTIIMNENAIVRQHIYEALGYEPRLAFEPEKIIVVEGKSDSSIITVSAKKLNRPIDFRRINFIPMGDRKNVEKYSPILAYTLTHKKCLIILDNDNSSPSDKKEEIIRKERKYKELIGSGPILNDSNFIVYGKDIYSIENFLLDVDAICELAQSIYTKNGSEIKDDFRKEVRNMIEKSKSPDGRIEKPKAVLENIWATYGLGIYKSEQTGSKIAEHLSTNYLENNPDISKMIDAICS